MTALKRITLPIGMALAAACGASEVPAQQIASSEAAIRAASEVGAERHPQAALHLKHARDRLTRAQMLSREGKTEEAERLLEQAEVDAELALVLTRKQQAQDQAERAREQLDSLPEG